MLTVPDGDDAGVAAAGRLRGVRHRLLDGERAHHQRRRQRHAAGPRRRGLGGDIDQQAGRRQYRCGAVRFGGRCGAGATRRGLRGRRRGRCGSCASRWDWWSSSLGLVSTSPRALRSAERLAPLIARHPGATGRAPMSGNPVADEVWRAMASLVIDNRDSWKRAVVERSRSAVQPDPGAAPAGQAADDGQAGGRGGDHGRARGHGRGQRPRRPRAGGARTPIRPIDAARWCR